MSYNLGEARNAIPCNEVRTPPEPPDGSSARPAGGRTRDEQLGPCDRMCGSEYAGRGEPDKVADSGSEVRQFARASPWKHNDRPSSAASDEARPRKNVPARAAARTSYLVQPLRAYRLGCHFSRCVYQSGRTCSGHTKEVSWG